MALPDTRIYATVLHTDHSLQYSLTVAVSIAATPLNFLSFYLILTKSKRERPSFKRCLFLAQFFYFLSQFHLGVFAGLVPLHPFPAAYSIGLLSEYVSTFTLCFVWSVLFCCYVYFTLIILIIRLRIVARPGKLFDCRDSVSYFFYMLLALYVFLPVPGVLTLSNSSEKDMKQFVRTRFPNNMMVFDNPGVFVFTNYDHADYIPLVLISIVVSALVFIAFMYIAITKEIRHTVASKSSKHAEDGRRSLNNLVVQSVSYAVFLSIAFGLILKQFFNDPSIDSRIQNSIAFTSLCGASIPCQIMMISRNTVYRSFVLRKTRLSSVSPSHSIPKTSMFLKA